MLTNQPRIIRNTIRGHHESHWSTWILTICKSHMWYELHHM